MSIECIGFYGKFLPNIGHETIVSLVAVHVNIIVSRVTAWRRIVNTEYTENGFT